jgi:hypothetical protein
MAAGVAITRLGFVASIPALQMNLDSVLAMFICEQVRSYSAFSGVNLQKSHVQYRAKRGRNLNTYGMGGVLGRSMAMTKPAEKGQMFKHSPIP